MTLQRFILNLLKSTPDQRRQAANNPAPVAKHYGISADRVGFYLKMMGEG